MTCLAVWRPWEVKLDALFYVVRFFFFVIINMLSVSYKIFWLYFVSLKSVGHIYIDDNMLVLFVWGINVKVSIY